MARKTSGLRTNVAAPTTPAIDVSGVIPALNRDEGDVFKIGYKVGDSFTFAYVRAHDGEDAWQLVLGQNPGAEQVSINAVSA
jgi:hypothetical protein